MNATQFTEYLKSIDACEEALTWQDGKDLQTVWNTCRRSDWMIWLINNSSNDVTDSQLRMIAVKCAREVQHLMNDQRSINALDVAERYANGLATDDELTAAWAAARDAAWDAARDAARDAAWDAARAAARAAAWDAAWDAARDAARAAAWAAAWDAARAAARKKQSGIIRSIIPMINIGKN